MQRGPLCEAPSVCFPRWPTVPGGPGCQSLADRRHRQQEHQERMTDIDFVLPDPELAQYTWVYENEHGPSLPTTAHQAADLWSVT